jgi:hypothetical protein
VKTRAACEETGALVFAFVLTSAMAAAGGRQIDGTYSEPYDYWIRRLTRPAYVTYVVDRR